MSQHKIKTTQNPEKAALVRTLETARRQISNDVGAVKNKLDVSQRFKDSVSDNTMKWVGGGIVAGVLLAVLSPIRFRKKKDGTTSAKRGMMGTALFGLLGLAGKQILLASLPQAQRVAQEWLVAKYDGIQSESADPPEFPVEE